MSYTGSKIIEGLREAVAGNCTSITIQGQTWVRKEKPSLIDLFLYEAAEADFNLKLAKLQEFYAASNRANRFNPRRSYQGLLRTSLWRECGALWMWDRGTPSPH